MINNDILLEFNNKIVNNSKDLPEGIAHLVSDHFWDLVYDKKDVPRETIEK